MFDRLKCLLGRHAWRLVKEVSVPGSGYTDLPMDFTLGGVDYHLRCAHCHAQRVVSKRGVWVPLQYPPLAASAEQRPERICPHCGIDRANPKYTCRYAWWRPYAAELRKGYWEYPCELDDEAERDSAAHALRRRKRRRRLVILLAVLVIAGAAVALRAI